MRNDTPRRYSPLDFEEASQWFVEIRAGALDEVARLAFNRWLRESPGHIGAYLDVAQSWALGGAHDVRERFPKERLIADALGDADTLVAYPGPSRESAPKRSRLWSLPAGRAGFSIGAGLAAGLVAFLSIAFWRPGSTYATGTGEQRSVTLADGSIVYLGARSRVRARFTSRERDVYLLAGEALFRDVHEPERPFVVHAGHFRIQAVGTAFDVNRLSAQDSIAVVEGEVAISERRPVNGPPIMGVQNASPSAPRAPDLIYISAGEQLELAAREPLSEARLRPVSADEVTAWVHHRLVFASSPLRNVVEEFNRYNDRQLIIVSPSLESFRIDGVFSSTTPTALLAFLRQIPGVSVTEYQGQILISRR